MTVPDPDMTAEEVHALFEGVRLRCPEPECGHDYEDDELGDREYDDEGLEVGGLTVRAVLDAYAVSAPAARYMLLMADVACPECQSGAAPAPVAVNHLDEWGAALVELHECGAMIAERVPELRERVEAMIAEAEAQSRLVILGAGA